jgi:hypothetical protein
MSANQIMLDKNFRLEEFKASGTVTPGMLIEQTSATAATARAHATQGGYAERLFAMEDALQGKVITDNYSDGDLVTAGLVPPGDRVNGLVEGGQNISIGERLISSGNGKLIAENAATSGGEVKQIIAVALEASNETEDVRIAMRVV